MASTDTKVFEASADEQLTVFEKDGKILIKTSDEFNESDHLKQSQIVSTVVDFLLKKSTTDTLLTFGLTEDGNISLSTLDRFLMLSLSTQSDLLHKLSLQMKKMAEIKDMEKSINSEYLH